MVLKQPVHDSPFRLPPYFNTKCLDKLTQHVLLVNHLVGMHVPWDSFDDFKSQSGDILFRVLNLGTSMLLVETDCPVPDLGGFSWDSCSGFMSLQEFRDRNLAKVTQLCSA